MDLGTHPVSLVGIRGGHSRAFLLILVAFTAPVFALPILLMPLTWARKFGWRLPREADGEDLAIYLGGCLGTSM